MATEVWCELVCARCSRTCGGRHTYNGRVPRRELKDAARQEGWTFNRNDESHCARCSEAIARETGADG